MQNKLEQYHLVRPRCVGSFSGVTEEIRPLGVEQDYVFCNLWGALSEPEKFGAPGSCSTSDVSRWVVCTVSNAALDNVAKDRRKHGTWFIRENEAKVEGARCVCCGNYFAFFCTENKDYPGYERRALYEWALQSKREFSCKRSNGRRKSTEHSGENICQLT